MVFKWVTEQGHCISQSFPDQKKKRSGMVKGELNVYKNTS